MKADEKRRRGRCPAKNLRVTTPIHGKVLDLSPLGMAVESSESLTIGQNRRFVLWRGWHRLQVNGTVRWCALVKTERERAGTVCPVYRAGIALEVPGPEAVRFLKRCWTDQ